MVGISPNKKTGHAIRAGKGVKTAAKALSRAPKIRQKNRKPLPPEKKDVTLPELTEHVFNYTGKVAALKVTGARSLEPAAPEKYTANFHYHKDETYTSREHILYPGKGERVLKLTKSFYGSSSATPYV